MHKGKNFLKEKNIKRTKPEHAFKGFASSYNVEIVNSFNPELQLKDTDAAISKLIDFQQAKSKLIDFLSELRIQ